MPSSDAATLVVWASALGGSFVGGWFAIANSWLNRRGEARREKERAEREDRREGERAERLSRDRLDDLRRLECVRLITSASLLVAIRPEKLTEDDFGHLFSAQGGLEDASDTLQLLGPESLAQAAFDLAGATRAHSNSGAKSGLPPEYTEARAKFYQVAKKVMGYDRAGRTLAPTTRSP